MSEVATEVHPCNITHIHVHAHACTLTVNQSTEKIRQGPVHITINGVVYKHPSVISFLYTVSASEYSLFVFKISLTNEIIATGLNVTLFFV